MKLRRKAGIGLAALGLTLATLGVVQTVALASTSISGKVTTSTGKPVVGVNVCAAEETTGTVAACTTHVTNSSGEYTITGLNSDTVYVVFVVGSEPSGEQSGVTTGSSVTLVVQTSASPVVKPTTATSQTTSISGVVETANGETVSDVNVVATNEDTLVAEGFAFTDANGAFTITGLKADATYVVTVVGGPNGASVEVVPGQPGDIVLVVNALTTPTPITSTTPTPITSTTPTPITSTTPTPITSTTPTPITSTTPTPVTSATPTPAATATATPAPSTPTLAQTGGGPGTGGSAESLAYQIELGTGLLFILAGGILARKRSSD
jgi:hypothetical protein